MKAMRLPDERQAIADYCQIRFGSRDVAWSITDQCYFVLHDEGISRVTREELVRAGVLESRA